MLITTIGAATTTSYVTVAEADQYFADRIHSAAWTSSTEQEAALVHASRQLDWYVDWKGTRVDNVQAMDWPRTEVASQYGTDYGVTDIPNEVKQAVFELALSTLAADRMADPDLAGLSMVQAGPLTIKTDAKDQNSDKVQPIPSHIWRIISHLSRIGLGVVRLSRA